MRPGIIIDVTAADRARLEAVVADRNSPQKHVWRAAIVLATADGLGTNAVMRRTGKSKTVVWRWQERFASDGVDGLLRDKTRPSRIAPFGPEVGERIVALTLAEPPGETTQWTGRAMAKAIGVSHSYVQRVWRSHGLQPHRILQALERPGFRGQGPRHRRALCRSARSCRGPLHRREEPDPGA
jgi:transposase